MNRFVRLIFYLLFFPLIIFAQETERPKNIILLIGDGMGLNYVAADVLKYNNSPFKRFSTVGLAITKSIDDLITDSAAAATAIATGYPTKNRYIAMDTSYNKLYTIFEHAEKLGLSTGMVVTDAVVGATPAAFVTHHNNRSEKKEIAEQLEMLNRERQAAEARMLERVTHARTPARTKCAPRNGVQDANTPVAQPSAMACGVARSLHKR